MWIRFWGAGQGHWFAVTIWSSPAYALKLWRIWFEQYLGEMQDQGYGGRLYETIYKALLEAKLYCTPKLADSADEDSQHFHFEFPGSACEALAPVLLQGFMLMLIGHDRFQVTRLDLAWDGVPFTPEDLNIADQDDLIRTYARRGTFRFEISRHAAREDGQIGHSIFRMGSRKSTRHLRLYDLHGPVRLELECRSKRADLIARDVLILKPDDWSDRAIPHLRDFLDIEEDYWNEFIQGHARASRTIVDARTKEMSRIAEWMFKHVSPSLSVMADVYGDEAVKAIVKRGRQKRGSRFNSLLEHAKSVGEGNDDK